MTRMADGALPPTTVVLSLPADLAAPEEELAETPIGTERIRYVALPEEVALMWPEHTWPAEITRLREACYDARCAYVGLCEGADADPTDRELTQQAVAAFALWQQVERFAYRRITAWRKAAEAGEMGETGGLGGMAAVSAEGGGVTGVGYDETRYAVPDAH